MSHVQLAGGSLAGKDSAPTSSTPGSAAATTAGQTPASPSGCGIDPGGSERSSRMPRVSLPASSGAMGSHPMSGTRQPDGAAEGARYA